MPAKIFVLPTGSGKLERFQLKHPKLLSLSDYLFDREQRKVFELNVKKVPFNCWMAENDLISDGNIYIVTPVDPLFLLIPILSSQRQQNFSSLFDHLSDANVESHWTDSLDGKMLACIADVKTFEDEIFVKFNREKTLNWLRLKFDKVKRSLETNRLGGRSRSGYSIGNFVPNNQAIEYDSLALEILSDYISQELAQELRAILKIPELKPIPKSACQKRKLDEPTIKFGGNGSDDDDNAITSNKNKKQTASKKAKTNNHRKPATTGSTRSISSYFQKR